LKLAQILVNTLVVVVVVVVVGANDLGRGGTVCGLALNLFYVCKSLNLMNTGLLQTISKACSQWDTLLAVLLALMARAGGTVWCSHLTHSKLALLSFSMTSTSVLTTDLAK